MQDLTVTLVQANQIWENKQANFENYERLLGSIPETDLIVLPEMFNTGFSMNAKELAEEYQSSKSIHWLKAIAAQKKAAVYTSLIISENSNFYNRGVFVEPSGKISHYDKRKTFGLAGEDKIYKAGNTTQIVDYLGWKIQLQICYDLRFPEISLNEIIHDSPSFDMLIYVANWPTKRVAHWNHLLPARAIENQCYVVGLNRIGLDPKNNSYSGDSKIISALGNELVKLESNETIVTFTISHLELQETRKNLPFLKDRHVRTK